MASKKIQLYTDRANTIEASPETSANCVILSDGNDLQKVLDNDLTTPTVVHEETSFKVGVGDVNVSSSVVDGEVGRMVIKGKTYQNILPEPSTPVLTNNKEMFKVNEGLYPNVEVVDGISKSAILSGQTLVNLSGQLTHHEKWVETGDDLVLNLPSGNGQPRINVGLVYKLKKDTIYTVVINMKLYETGYPHICFMDESNRQLASDREWTPSSTGVLKTTFTTSSTVEASILRIIPRNGIDNIYTIGKKIIILEGDYTNQDIPYFEGMSSCKMPVLQTIGKNLFEGNKAMDGYGFSEREVIVKDTWFISNYIEVKPNLSYIISASDNSVVGRRVNFYDKDKNFVETGRYENLIITVPNNNNIFYMRTNADLSTKSSYQIEQGTVATTYEPYKTNILHTPEEITLKGIGDVRDTLNCNTGEYVERVKEIVLNGSGSEDWQGSSSVNGSDDLIRFYTGNGLGVVASTTGNFYCDKVKVVDNRNVGSSSGECVFNNSTTGSFPNGIQFQVSKDKATTLAEWKQYLSQNPITVQYPVTTPIVKTVDLSSSGNWEKVVLDGSESITMVQSNRLFQIRKTVVGIPVSNQTGDNPYILTETPSFNTWGLDTYNNYNSSKANSICYHRETFFIQLEKEGSVEEMVSRLQQKPLVIWYQIRTHQDSTQVKQPIFFKDGHIQLSSGADNSLIPTLDYQAKTSNSYVMDLMKTNTKYTMKAKSASGTFTIDGTSYGAGTNGTFTTPSSMTNKFLVMSNKTNEEVMILEGNVVSKTIPYFKGIKSAFEDESKIEVLSTDSNLLINNQRLQEEGVLYYTKGWNAVRLTTKAKKVKIVVKNKTGITGTRLKVKDDVESESNFMQLFAANEVFTRIEREYSLKNSNVISFCSHGSLTFNDETFFDNYDIEVYTLDNMDETLVVEKSNNTKIPLLSPLRSLPNGVCDELIIDRMKKKVTLIQRVGAIFLNGNEQWSAYPTKEQANTLLFQTRADIAQGKNHSCISDKVPHSSSLWSSGFDSEGVMMGGGGDSLCKRVDLRIAKTKVSSNSPSILQSYLHKNPLTAQYELATPVVTEIDLENFPLVYKDGHVFLNSEIAPVVEIGYNVNQSQQIQANNETLQRHELDILDLDNLIVSFVNAEYNLRLLKFDMELSMMALDE